MLLVEAELGLQLGLVAAERSRHYPKYLVLGVGQAGKGWFLAADTHSFLVGAVSQVGAHEVGDVFFQGGFGVFLDLVKWAS